MTGYLSVHDLLGQREQLRGEFDRLLARRSVVHRPRSRQWSFFRHCFEVTTGHARGDFACSKAQALQYKFEVEDRLQRYYLSRGEAMPYLFRLMHRAKALEHGFVDDEYPTANEYVLLVAANCGATPKFDPRETRDVIERVVIDAIDAEWTVYRSLPDMNLVPLDGVFLDDGAAYQRIRHLAERHHERRWTIRRPDRNPSTKRVLELRVLKLTETEAWVRTKEYWYLRWFSEKTNDYAQVDYRETNRQKYVLVNCNGSWLVQDNIYPPPRAQTPHRKRIVVG